MARDDENPESGAVDPADLETRVDLEDEADPTSDGARSAGDADGSARAAALSTREAAALAETVISDEDRTHLVERSEADRAASADRAGVGPATRALAETQAAGGVVAATRVLDAPDDKTSPPPVEAPSAGTRPSPSAAAPDPDRGLLPGMVLFGEYEIVNVLGVGGMGEVYRARHRRLDEFRAIKVMHADLSKKKGASEFFYREAKALLAVRHPAVVHCHDLLSDDAGRVYLVMEMIEGIPLSKRMNDGPLSPDDVAILGARVSHGLSAAHRKGVIHRDVSPDNIVLPNGRVQEAKIIDFGIAKILEEGEGTIVDGFKGKLSYASPEQLGFFGGKLDGRSDFYSLGLVLVAAALGKPMGMGTTVMEAVDARRGFTTLPDEIPVGLRSAIQPLLELDPKDRPKYVDRLFVVPGGIEGTDPGGYSLRRGDDRERSRDAGGDSNRAAVMAAVGLAAVLVVGGGAWWATSGGSVTGDREAATPAPAAAGAAEATLESPAAEALVAPPIVAPPREPVVVKAPETAAPAKPAPRRLTARDRIRIIGLLNNAELALGENRLMSPAGDNAYDRYVRVLEMDPSNRDAKKGLRSVAGRYLSLAESAVANGNGEQARDYLERARKADASHPKLAEVSRQLMK